MADIDYSSILKEYNDKLYDQNVGLTSDDYIELVKLLKEIKSELNEENNEYYEEVRELLNLLLKSGVATGLSYENYRYVLNELSPLPFVFANRSKTYPPKSYEFFRSTQFKFYNYSDPPIVKMQIVKNGRVQQFDFINGKKLKKDDEQQFDYLNAKMVKFESLSNVEYIARQEKITFKEALLVLLGVYNCKNSIHNETLLRKIKKYQKVLKSNEYRDFLFEAIERSKENETYGDEQIEFYKKRFDERYIVEKGKVNPNFKYQSVPKVLVLERK